MEKYFIFNLTKNIVTAKNLTFEEAIQKVTDWNYEFVYKNINPVNGKTFVKWIKEWFDAVDNETDISKIKQLFDNYPTFRDEHQNACWLSLGHLKEEGEEK